MQIYRTPRAQELPSLCYILDNIKHDDKILARYLGLQTKTMQRYRRSGQAPMSVMWALFWITSWGRETVETDLINARRMLYSENLMLKHKNRQLVKQMSIMEREYLDAKMGAANAPIYQIG